MPTTQGYDPGFVGAAYEAPNYLQDTQRSVNWYCEISPDPHAKEVIGLLGAPGTTDLITLLTGKPVRQAWVLPGGGKALAVCGTNVYLVTQDAVGNLNATLAGALLTPIGPVQIRDNGYVAVLVDGAYGYTYLLNTGAFAQITDTGFTGFASRVAMVDGWFIFNQANSRNFYLSPQYLGINGNVNQGLQNTKWDPTAVAVAYATGDLLVSLIEDQRLVWLPKERATEVWYDAGAQFFTFNRMQGVLLQIGCAAAQSVARISKGLMWLAANERGQNFVIRTQGFDYDRVSTHAIDFAISSYSTVSDALGWSYIENGHEFYVLTFPTADVTWAYDTGTGLWHERLSFDPVLGQYHRHRGNCVINFQNRRLIGTKDTGALAWMDRSQFMDGGNPLVAWRRTGHIWDKQSRRRVFHHQLQIETDPGVGTSGLPGLVVTTGTTHPLAKVWENDATGFPMYNGTSGNYIAIPSGVTGQVRIFNRNRVAAGYSGGDGNTYSLALSNGAVLPPVVPSAVEAAIQTNNLVNAQFKFLDSGGFFIGLILPHANHNCGVYANFAGLGIPIARSPTRSSAQGTGFGAWVMDYATGTRQFDVVSALSTPVGLTGTWTCRGLIPCADGEHVGIITYDAMAPAKGWLHVLSINSTTFVATEVAYYPFLAEADAANYFTQVEGAFSGNGLTAIGGNSWYVGMLESNLQRLWANNANTIATFAISGGQVQHPQTITPMFNSFPTGGFFSMFADGGVCIITDGTQYALFSVSSSTTTDRSVQSPRMILKWSDDGGKTFGNEKFLAMGQIGQYRNRSIAYNLGYSRDRIYDLRVIDAVNRDLIGATLMSETEQ